MCVSVQGMHEAVACQPVDLPVVLWWLLFLTQETTHQRSDVAKLPSVPYVLRVGDRHRMRELGRGYTRCKSQCPISGIHDPAQGVKDAPAEAKLGTAADQ